MRAAFVTNNAARTPEAVAAHLVELGVRAEPSDVVTSAQAGARMLAERLPAGARVLVIGGPGVGAALRERGLVPVESVDEGAIALIQGYGPDVGWRELAEGSLAIGRGLPWVATNLDRTIPGPRGRVLGNGSMVAALRHATGIEPLVAGKPEPPLMLESVERSRAVRPLVVGDRLDTDIEGANRCGIPSLLVFTGVTDWPDLLHVAPPYRPTFLGRDLRALLAPAPVVEVRAGAGMVEGRCGGVVVRIPAGDATDDAGHPSTGPEPGGGQLDPGDLWWLPESLRVPAVGAPDATAVIDLDLVRAVVAATWSIVDAGAAIIGPAQVHAATR
jgi:HAD superfamily hydrolase (TIGR01450 family)